MLFNGFETPLHLKRKPSRMLAGYLLGGHMLALLALSHALAVPFVLHLGLWLLWGASLVYHGYRYWPRSYDSQAWWVWQARSDWVYNSAPAPALMQLHNAVVTAWFILVTLRNAQTTRRCLYFADQLEADTWRRLRVRLGDVQAKDICGSGDCP